MSKTLKENKEFLFLLLTTEKRQANQLLKFITLSQLNVLSEISLNLLQLKLNSKIDKIIKKRKKLLKLLSSTKVKQNKKLKLVVKH